MGEAWFILTKRFGAEVSDPSADVLEAAVREVVDPEYANDIEHTNAFVRYGRDEGPMYVLTYDMSRSLTFEQWADQDFGAELVPEGDLSKVSPAEAMRLMQELRTGGVDHIKQQPWATER